MARGALVVPLILAATACAPPAPQTPSTPVSVPSAAPAPADPPAPKRAPNVGPRGEVATLKGSRVLLSLPGGERFIEPEELHPPSGDPSIIGIDPTAVLYLDDGTLLVGAGDGTVSALDGDGHRRWSIGFRGAVGSLAPAGEGLVAVTTHLGVIALLATTGKLRWERQVAAERLGPVTVGPDNLLLTSGARGLYALTPRGDLAFTHAAYIVRQCCDDKEPPAVEVQGDVISAHGMKLRAGDRHPPIPSLAPSFALRFEKKLNDDVVSLLAVGPSEILALVKRDKDSYEVVRADGGPAMRARVPSRVGKAEKDQEEPKKPARKAWLWSDLLVQGPNGTPWIIGRKMWSPESARPFRYGPGLASGQVLEMSGSAFREKNDLPAAFAEAMFEAHNPAEIDQAGAPNVFCFGATCGAFDGGRVHAIETPSEVVTLYRVGGATWISTKGGPWFRVEGHRLVPIAKPIDPAPRSLAGANERDLWAVTDGDFTLSHADGAGWTVVGVPTMVESGLVYRAPDDVWSRNGRAHWDGKAWSMVYGAPDAGNVIARGPSDVWLGGQGGLWRSVAPGPSPVRLAAPAYADEGALPPPPPLSLEAPETGYLVERVTVAVAGGEALASANNVVASPGGRLWMLTRTRIVEVEEDGKGTTVQTGEWASFSRMARPTGKGRGILLERDAIFEIDGKERSPAEVQLDRQNMVAVDAVANGPTWFVGAFWHHLGERWMPRAYEHSAHALVRDGDRARPVLGLPSAAWCDVAAAPDGGAWFAGAQSPGPMGEGILVHARGRLGAEGTTLYRAPATLLAVTAPVAGEAWAVGAAGAVIHVQGSTVTRHTLPSGAWLRAAASAGSADVWLAGDDGTLLHYDGRALRSITHPLGPRAAFTGLAFSRGALWAVSPSGILKITRTARR